MALGAVDMPSARKVHDRPIPRLGGLAVLASCIAGLSVSGVLPNGQWLLSRPLAFGLGAGLVPIFAISFIDDIRGVRAGYKLVAHGLGAAIAVGLGVTLGDEVHLFGASIALGSFAIPLSLLWMIGVTNAFNLIDGLDGLSAGLALISAVAMAAVFMLVGQTTMAGASLVLAGAIIGFLPSNLYPARLFLGDTGATAIGFCLAGFSLKGGSTLSAGFAALVPVFIMGLPIADTLVSMTRRVIGRLENASGGPFRADRNHIHHRLLALGIGHRTAVFILYGAGFVLSAAAFLSVFVGAHQAALMVAALMVAGFVGIGRLGYDEFALIRRGTLLKMYDAPVLRRSLFVVFVDLAMVVAAVYVAVGLKTDDWTLALHRDQAFAMAGLLAPLSAIAFWRAGLYKGSWRLASVGEYTTACLSAAGVAAAGLFVFSFSPVGDHYVTAFLIYGLISVVMVCASRGSYRVFFSSHQRASSAGRPVIIYGAGNQGARAVEELFNNAAARLKPVGFIDDDATKKGRTVGGLPVLGGLSDLSHVVGRIGAKAVVVASDKIPGEHLERTAEICSEMDVPVYRLNLKFEELSVTAAPVVPSTITAGVERTFVGSAASRAAAPDADVALTGGPRLALALAEIHLASQRCSSCRSLSLHRSHTRNVFERLRKAHTPKRPYRCDECGWRGWLQTLEFGSGGALIPEPIARVDVTALDASFRRQDLVSVGADFRES